MEVEPPVDSKRHVKDVRDEELEAVKVFQCDECGMKYKYEHFSTFNNKKTKLQSLEKVSELLFFFIFLPWNGT